MTLASTLSTNGFLLVGGLVWAILAWWLIIVSSIWGIRHVLAGTRPRLVTWVGVAAMPIVMFGGGWIAYGIYRLARPGNGWASSPRGRAFAWGAPAVGFWALAIAIAEWLALDLEGHPQPGQQAWVTVFRWLPVAPLLAGSLGLAVSAARGGTGWRLAHRFAQAAFWAALAVLYLVGPKPN